MSSTMCVNTRHDVVTVDVDRIVWKIRNWILREWNMAFTWDEIILKLCLENNIFSSYNFLTETTLTLKKEVLLWLNEFAMNNKLLL